MLYFDRYALREYGVEFDESIPDVKSVNRLLELLRVKRVSDGVRKEIFDSLIFNEDDFDKTRMDIAKMDNVPLAQCQQALRNRDVSTAGFVTYPEEVIDSIDLYKMKVRELIISLHSDPEQEFPFNKELDLFAKALEKSLKTVYKVLIRAGLKIEFTDIELQDALCNLQDMMAFVLSLQSKEVMRKTTFTKASNLTPYWSEEIKYLLSDENILKTLIEADIDVGDLNIPEVFTNSVKLRFAVGYILDPLGAVRRVASHMTDTLSDKNIEDTLKEADIDLGNLKLSDIFTNRVKLRFAVKNISDPLDAVRRVASHITDTLSDKNIEDTLKEADIDLGNLKLSDIFTNRVKLHFAIGNISDPLDAVRRFASHMSETLSDYNITKELDNAGIDLGNLKLSDIFTNRVKLTFALNNISDPLGAVRRVASHITDTLSDKNIEDTLKEADIDLGNLNIPEVFTNRVKLTFAVGYISDPLDAVRRVAIHMTDTLSDKNIEDTLKEADIDLGNLNIPEVFTNRVKLTFAVKNISDPLDAVRRFASHMSETLSDDNITKELDNAGIDLGDLNIPEVFTNPVKLRFAVGNISDPLDACVRYIKGDIKYGGKYYKTK